MTGEEIRSKINKNNKIVQAMFNPNQFVLNNTILKLLEENKELQAQCNHVFDNGYCIYCDKEEDSE